MASFDNTSPKSTSSSKSATTGDVSSTRAASGADRFSSSRQSGGTAADEVREIATDLGEKAKGVASQAQETASEVGGHLAEAATKLAQSQVKAGADLLQNVSKAATAAAKELDQTAPEVGRYISEAASSLDGFARDMQERTVGDLFNSFSDFARRQPLTVMMGSVFVGFVVSRFLKSNAERSGFQADRRPGRSFDQGAASRSARRDYGTREGSAASRGDWEFGSPGRPETPGTRTASASGNGSGPSSMTTDGTFGEYHAR